MTQTTIYLLCGGGLVLGLVGVIIDRLNFPQRPFVAKGVRVAPGIGATRDRTGAHIINIEPVPIDEASADALEPSGEER